MDKISDAEFRVY